jgi:hypothetical protein
MNAGERFTVQKTANKVRKEKTHLYAKGEDDFFSIPVSYTGMLIGKRILRQK